MSGNPPYKLCGGCGRWRHKDEMILRGTFPRAKRICLFCVERENEQGKRKSQRVLNAETKRRKDRLTLTPEQVRELMRRPGVQFMEVG